MFVLYGTFWSFATTKPFNDSRGTTEKFVFPWLNILLRFTITFKEIKTQFSLITQLTRPHGANNFRAKYIPSPHTKKSQLTVTSTRLLKKKFYQLNGIAKVTGRKY